MYTASSKIRKDKGLEPSEFEDSVAQVILTVLYYFWLYIVLYFTFKSLLFMCIVFQAFFDLENSNQELKSDLKDLYINNAM